MQHTLLLLLLFTSALVGQTQIGQDIDGEAAGDNSGTSVSLSGDGQRLAIGAPLNDGSSGNAGHVRIYEVDATGNWQQLGQDIDGEAKFDNFGNSVSLSANGLRVAIGAQFNDGSGNSAGHVRIYGVDATGNWQQLGQDIDGAAAGDLCGRDVSLSADGHRVAIGAIYNDDRGRDAGHVRIYEFDATGNWQQLGQDIDGEAANDRSGWSVSLSADGNRVAIGAPFNDGNGTDAGHVRIYEFDATGIWQQLGQDIQAEAANDRSGWSVSLSADGNRVAIGAIFNSGSSYRAGHVRIYEIDATGDWQQLGQDIDGEAREDYSGWSVSLSADGLRVAVGAYQNSENGRYAGHTRMYELDTAGAWQQLGQDIDAEAATDFLGEDVSLSADGLRVATGAPRNDGNGTDAGHVRVYQLSPMQSGALPVTWLHFTALKGPNGAIHLDWSTQLEVNNRGFNIERSPNGINWSTLGFVPGNNQYRSVSNYSYVDYLPLSGSANYRLKQFDVDGIYEYSPIVTVGSQARQISVFPNPSPGVMHVVGLEAGYIQVIDIHGRVVLDQKFSNSKLDLSGLPNGPYILSIQEQKESFATGVIKRR